MRWTIKPKHAKKWDILTEKRESWMVLEKHDFPQESSNVDTYDLWVAHAFRQTPLITFYFIVFVIN